MYVYLYYHLRGKNINFQIIFYLIYEINHYIQIFIFKNLHI